MTDPTHVPNQPSAPSVQSAHSTAPLHEKPPSATLYEGTEPDLPDRQSDEKRSVVSTVQVGASAAAAVTSALAASFFGVAGTLIGAAVGSVVSTIAGALYTEYLNRAGQRLRGTKDVVIQRIPGEVLATSPLRHLTSPADLPGERSLRPIGEEPGDESVAVPLAEPTELLASAQPMEHTQVIPAVTDRLPPVSGTDRFARVNGTDRIPPVGGTRPIPAGRLPDSGGVDGGTGDGTDGGTTAPLPGRSWLKPVLALAGVATAGFLIALGVVLATEGALGHPVSGGTSGTTLSNLGDGGGSTQEEEQDAPSTDVTPTVTATPSTDVTQSPSAGPTVTRTDPAVPPTTSAPTVTVTRSAEPEPEPTAEAPETSAPEADEEAPAPEASEAP